MKKYFYNFLTIAALLGSVLLPPAPARSETVSFPLQLDYPFLTSLVVQSAFNDPGQTMIVADPGNPCRQITLSSPNIVGENNLLRMDVAVHLMGGTSRAGGKCMFAVTWDGYVAVHMKPRMRSGDWRLSFEPVDAILLDKHRQPAGLMGRLWDYFKAPVLARLGNIKIAANQPIDELTSFLLSIVPESDIPRVKTLLGSLRPGEILADADALKIQFLADLETAPAPSVSTAPEPLTPEEIDSFIEIWETWDAFLVQEMVSLSDMPLTMDEKEILLTVLLETRYRFVDAISTVSSENSGDFVREEFISAWEKLSPILKRHLSGRISGNSWGYLAFFTASDALAVLDKIGPVFNLEISRNGLIRLARMLSENKEVILQYSPEVDPALRKILGLEPAPEITGPDVEPDVEPDVDENSPAPEKPSPENPPTSMGGNLRIMEAVFQALTPAVCWAQPSESSPSLAELRQWLVTRDNVDAHFKKIKPLLAAATKENLKKNSIPESHRKMFEKAVYATAWQESCFRQFVVDNNKLTYLLSYNNSSVGMMQINERVWRGIYNLQYLRWDIAYNAAAGIDILNLYLQKYALPKMPSLAGKETLDADGLAGAIYAMYNAGPGAFSAYVKRRSTRQFSKIDNHFKEKYAWVKEGRWEKVKDCF